MTTALEYLESKGVLHRDVSPGNVGSVAGRGVLYDFSSSKVGVEGSVFLQPMLISYSWCNALVKHFLALSTFFAFLRT